MPCHDTFYNVSTNNSTNIMNYDNTNCDTRRNYRMLKKVLKIDAYFPNDSHTSRLEIYHPLYQPLCQPPYDNGQLDGYQPLPYNP